MKYLVEYQMNVEDVDGSTYPRKVEYRHLSVEDDKEAIKEARRFGRNAKLYKQISLDN